MSTSQFGKGIGTSAAVLVLMALAGHAHPAPLRLEENNAPAVVRGSNALALDLYAQMTTGNTGNVVFAPYGVSHVLGLAYTGSRGATAEQLAAGLHFKLTPANVPAAFASWRQAVQRKATGPEAPPGPQLTSANALWGQKGLGFRADFKEHAARGFAAEVREIDFKADPEKARQEINAWVSEQTKGKFSRLLAPGSVSAGTEVVLANAVYLKAAWARPFNKKHTEDAPFFIANDKQVVVPLMRQSGAFHYYRGKGFQVLEIPYQGNELAMVLVVPDRRIALAAVEKQLSAANLADWQAKMKKQEVLVYLPRFRVAFERELREDLTALRMRLAFSPEGDFSGMTGKKNFHLSAVMHRAYIAVDEAGTEAAAATGGIIRTGIDDMTVVRADRPFLFLLRDTRTNAILFLGRLVTP